MRTFYKIPVSSLSDEDDSLRNHEDIIYSRESFDKEYRLAVTSDQAVSALGLPDTPDPSWIAMTHSEAIVEVRKNLWKESSSENSAFPFTLPIEGLL